MLQLSRVSPGWIRASTRCRSRISHRFGRPPRRAAGVCIPLKAVSETHNRSTKRSISGNFAGLQLCGNLISSGESHLNRSPGVSTWIPRVWQRRQHRSRGFPLPTCFRNVQTAIVQQHELSASRRLCLALAVSLAGYSGQGHAGSPKSTSSIPPYPRAHAAVGTGKRLHGFCTGAHNHFHLS